MTSHSRLIDVGQVTSERVKKFHSYWQSKATGGSVPPRIAMDPAEIPRLLSYLVIADIERKPLRIRYRLVGTWEVDAHGTDFTGRYLDQCNFAVEPLLTECYRRLIGTRAPVFAYYEWSKSNWHKPTGRAGACETGFFPLSSDGAAIDGAISMADSDVRPWRRND